MNKNKVKIIHSLPPQMNITKKKPLNYQPENDELFEIDNKINVPEMNLFKFQDSFIHEDGAVEIDGKIHPNSLRHPHGMLKEYSRFNMLKKKLKFKKGIIQSSRPIVVVSDHWSGEYYHWIIEALPRLLFYKSHLGNPLFVLSYRHQESYHKESLELLGVKPSDLFFMQKKTRYYVKEAYFCDFPGPIDIHRGNLINDISTKLINASQENSNPAWRKVYLSRQKAKRRRILNPEPLEEFLTAKGFEIVFTEEMSLRDQIKLFYETETLITVHGAGLSNILFMQENTNVIEIRKNCLGYHPCGKKQTTELQNTYWNLANIKGLNYFYLPCPAESPEGDHHSDLFVNVQNLADMVPADLSTPPNSQNT